MLIDHTNQRVLDVLENRDKTSVIAYLAAGKASGLLAELEEVTTDMWDGYVTAVPAAARCSAIAAPMPFDAPVTTATCPSSFFDMTGLLLFLRLCTKFADLVRVWLTC